MIVRATRAVQTSGRVVRGLGKVARPPLPKQIGHGENLELVGHLSEVRNRIIVVLTFVVGAFVAAFAYHEQIIVLLNASLPASVAEPVTLGVAEPFTTAIKLSLWASFAVTLPVIIWQVWGFVAPVFDRAARRSALIFLAVGTVLFAAGVSFSYLVALPSAVQFLASYDAHLYDIQLRARDFYTFAAAVLVSVGLVFELPILLLALMRFKVLTTDRLRSNRKYCYLVLTVIAVLLPGVDPVLTLMMLIPLGLLFEATLLAGRILERRWNVDASDHAASETPM